MRGPIDFIIVGFEGNKFDGSIMKALSEAVSNGTIAVLALSVMKKDANGKVTMIDMAYMGDEMWLNAVTGKSNDLIKQEDIDEVSELLEDNTAAGLLVVEHLWAIPLKQAITDANGVLIADGRIHPDAAMELSK